MLSRYRATGADLPFGDPARPHGVRMEGWYWRFTQPERAAVVVALAGINRDRDGRPWGTVALAAHPGGFSASAAIDGAHADADGGVRVGAALRAGRTAVRVDLGPDARLDVVLGAGGRWPRRAFGGLGAAQSLPGLSQYWHPWLLWARVHGRAIVGGHEIDLDGATAYAEKNWSNEGFPRTWWWGQAHGFAADPAACVAFAGGEAGVGPLRMRATALVVAAAGEHVHLVRAGRLGGALRVAVGTQGWRLAGRTPRGTAVTVEGEADGASASLLPVPLPAEGRNRDDAVAQHLAGRLTLTLRRRGRLVLRDASELAGLEHGRLTPPAWPDPPLGPGPRRR